MLDNPTRLPTSSTPAAKKQPGCDVFFSWAEQIVTWLRWALLWMLAAGGSLAFAPPLSAEPRRLSEAAETRPHLLPVRNAPSSAKEPTSRAMPASTSVWGSLAGLAVVVVGMLVASRWLRVHGPSSLRGLPNEALEPLGQRVLSRGVAVHLVRCGTRMLVLGVGPDGIRTLSEITDPVEVDLLAGACRRRDETAGGNSFSQLFTRETATNRNGSFETRPRRSQPVSLAETADG